MHKEFTQRTGNTLSKLALAHGWNIERYLIYPRKFSDACRLRRFPDEGTGVVDSDGDTSYWVKVSYKIIQRDINCCAKFFFDEYFFVRRLCFLKTIPVLNRERNIVFSGLLCFFGSLPFWNSFGKTTHFWEMLLFMKFLPASFAITSIHQLLL